MTKFKFKKLKNLELLLFPGIINKFNFNSINFIKIYLNNLNFIKLKNIFKIVLKEKKKFCYLYNLKFKQLKKFIKNIKNEQILLKKIKVLNMRLDLVLFNTKLFSTLTLVRSFIKSGHVFVNGIKIIFSKFKLNVLDCITLKKNFEISEIENISIPKKNSYLIININTFNIFILREIYYRELFHIINYKYLLFR